MTHGDGKSNKFGNGALKRCERSVVDLEYPFVLRSLLLFFVHCMALCSDIYMRLGQIPLYRKMPVDLFPKIQVL